MTHSARTMSTVTIDIPELLGLLDSLREYSRVYPDVAPTLVEIGETLSQKAKIIAQSQTQQLQKCASRLVDQNRLEIRRKIGILTKAAVFAAKDALTAAKLSSFTLDTQRDIITRAAHVIVDHADQAILCAHGYEHNVPLYVVPALRTVIETSPSFRDETWEKANLDKKAMESMIRGLAAPAFNIGTEVIEHAMFVASHPLGEKHKTQMIERILNALPWCTSERDEPLQESALAFAIEHSRGTSLEEKTDRAFKKYGAITLG